LRAKFRQTVRKLLLYVDRCGLLKRGSNAIASSIAASLARKYQADRLKTNFSSRCLRPIGGCWRICTIDREDGL
jgi:hypothetical protein